MRKPSITTAIACLALFFSLTGVGIAASKYLITSTSQIKPNVLNALKGKQGPAGPAGPAGAAGIAGAAGASFTTSDVTVVPGTEQILCASGGGSCDTAVASASCPAGSVAVGGGWDGNTEPPVDASVAYNEPTVGDAGWEVGIVNNGVIGATFTPYAVCAS
jgi:hypothetical protein